MAMNPAESTNWGGRDRRRLALQVVVLVLVAMVFVVGTNMLAKHLLTRFPWMRADLTEVKLHSLSDTTRGLLESQQPDADITVVFKSLGQTRSQVTAEQEALARLLDLLGEYRLLAPGLNVTTVDVDRDPSRARDIADRLELRELQPAEVSRVVVEAGGRRRDIPQAAWVSIDYGDGRRPASIVAFPAEDALTSALVHVLDPTPPEVHFLTGHGEGDPDAEDPAHGFSQARELLEQIGLEVRTLDLAARGEVPDEAAAVLVAGVRSDFTKAEAEALAAYFRRGGRGYFLLDPGVALPNVRELLRPYNLTLMDPELIVIDSKQHPIGADWDELAIKQGITGYHPITESLSMTGRRVHLGRSRPIRRTVVDTTMSPVSLLKTATRERDLSFLMRLTEDRSVRVRKVEFDEERDYHDGLEFDLAFAVESPGSEGTARLVTFGSSSFASNARIRMGANQQLFVNVANWLVDREFRLGIPPRTDLDRTFVMTEENDRKYLLLFVAGIPGLAALLGIATWVVRRR